MSGKLFAATNATFSLRQTLNVGSQSTGAGKVTFDPLHLALAASPQSVALDRYLFNGTGFQTVALGTATADAAFEVDNLKLVAVSTDSLDLIAGTHALSLGYGALQQQTATKTPSGLSTTDTQDWNRIRNVFDNTDAPLDVSTGTPTTTTPTTSTTTAPTAKLASNPKVSALPAADLESPALDHQHGLCPVP